MSNHFSIRRQNEISSSPFVISSLQWLEDYHEPSHAKVHYNHHYEMIWVTAGSITHYTDLQETSSDDQRLFLTRPGQEHRFSLYENTRGYRICFTEAFLDIEDRSSDGTYYHSLFRLFSNPDGKVIESPMVADFQEIMQRMITEYSSSHLFRTEVLRRYFKIFLIYLARLFEDHMVETRYSRNAEIMKNFMCSLEKRYKTQKMVSEYAAEMQVTPNYLNEVIKKMTGHSAGYHIRKRIVLEAKRLCCYSDYCMKEIAYHLGFTDSAHFSKFFKSITGMNFSEFKKEQIVVLPAA